MSNSYFEGIDLLYSHNTFIFLQNDTLAVFSSSISSKCYACIKSVHLHWQFREYPTSHARAPWNEDSFGMTVQLLAAQHMPQLDHLSIFLQGPLNRRDTCQTIIWHICNLQSESTSQQLKFFVVRFPYFWTSWDNVQYRHEDMEDLLTEPSLPFRIARPTGTSQGTLADLDTGVDVGWRYGVLFLPSGDGSSESTTRDYLVWTPLPKGGKWPYYFPP